MPEHDLEHDFDVAIGGVGDRTGSTINPASPAEPVDIAPVVAPGGPVGRARRARLGIAGRIAIGVAGLRGRRRPARPGAPARRPQRDHGVVRRPGPGAPTVTCSGCDGIGRDVLSPHGVGRPGLAAAGRRLGHVRSRHRRTARPDRRVLPSPDRHRPDRCVRRAAVVPAAHPGADARDRVRQPGGGQRHPAHGRPHPGARHRVGPAAGPHHAGQHARVVAARVRPGREGDGGEEPADHVRRGAAQRAAGDVLDRPAGRRRRDRGRGRPEPVGGGRAAADAVVGQHPVRGPVRPA